MEKKERKLVIKRTVIVGAVVATSGMIGFKLGKAQAVKAFRNTWESLADQVLEQGEVGLMVVKTTGEIVHLGLTLPSENFEGFIRGFRNVMTF